jgi:hypothetical protein
LFPVIKRETHNKKPCSVDLNKNPEDMRKEALHPTQAEKGGPFIPESSTVAPKAREFKYE